MNFLRPDFNRRTNITLFMDIFTFILVERYDLQWIFECYVIDSCLARRNGEIRIRDLKVSGKNEVLAFDAWKADKQKQWNQDMATKEEAYQQKISSLESQLRTERDKIVQTGAEQQREKDKGFILAMSMKEKDLKEKTKEIAWLRKVVCWKKKSKWNPFCNIIYILKSHRFSREFWCYLDLFVRGSKNPKQKWTSKVIDFQGVVVLDNSFTKTNLFSTFFPQQKGFHFEFCKTTYYLKRQLLENRWPFNVHFCFEPTTNCKDLNNTRISLKIDDILKSVPLFAFLTIFYWLFLDFSPGVAIGNWTNVEQCQRTNGQIHDRSRTMENWDRGSIPKAIKCEDHRDSRTKRNVVSLDVEKSFDCRRRCAGEPIIGLFVVGRKRRRTTRLAPAKTGAVGNRYCYYNRRTTTSKWA